jgi:hypothetical protein
MINALDVLSRVTLDQRRELVRTALGDDYTQVSDHACEVLDKIAGMLGRPDNPPAPLDVIRYAVSHAIKRGQDEADVAVLLAAGADWIEARERQADADTPALDLEQWQDWR